MSLRERDIRLLLDSVARLYDPPSGDFIRHALSVVRDLVPGETRAYHEVDVGTRGLSFIDDPPGVFGSPAMLRDIVERTFPDHPIVGHYVRNPGEARILAVSDLVGRRTLQRLGIFHEFYRPFGMEDQIAVPFSVGPGRMKGLTINRAAWAFTAREHALLRLVQPHFVPAHRRATRSRQADALLRAADVALDRRRSGVLVLNRRDTIHAAAGRAMPLLHAYFGPPRRADVLPDAVRAWLRQQKERASIALSAAPDEPLVLHRDEARLVVHFLPHAALGRDALLLEDQRTFPAVEDLQALELSRREAEVLRWIVYGRSNVEIALILDIAVPTVKKHVEHIFTKLGVENRQAAAARAREIAEFGAPR